MSTPEGKVKRKVSALLAEYGERVYTYMPVPGGFGAPSLDYLCCVQGKFLAIETKAPDKKPTGRQGNTIREMRNAGATVFVIIGDDGLSELKAWLQANT